MAVSKRISLYTDEVQLTALLDQLRTNLSEGTRVAALKNIKDNKDWLISVKYSDTVEYLSNEIRPIVEAENQLILPKTSAPQRYNIHLDVRNIQTGSRDFTGRVEIDVQVRENTDKIIIHSKTQVIHELTVTSKDGLTEVSVFDYHLSPAADTLTIYFANDLAANSEIVVSIKYSTQLLVAASGFYLTSYLNNNQVRYLGATQFESTNARYAFPGYDEPRYKAVFELSITHDQSLHAIANTFGNEILK